MGGLSTEIDTIPFDAMVTRRALGHYGGRWGAYCPPLGPLGGGEDPVTVTELKRKILLSYLRPLQTALQQARDIVKQN